MHYFKLPLVNSVKKSPIFCLSFPWVAGLLHGMHFAFAASESISSFMHAVVYCHVSIVGLLLVLFFPLFISAIAISVPVFLFPLSFIKALSYGFCFCSVMYAFGSAGWLFTMMLLFSDLCMSVLLNWLWCRHLFGNKYTLRRDMLYCSLAVVLIGLVDYFLVSPYLVDLLHYF